MNQIIAALAKHRIASNVLMFVIILMGLWSLNKINTQSLPDFELKLIQAQTTWAGASVDDVQQTVAQPIEQAILTITDIDSVNSRISEGSLSISMTVKDYVDDVNPVIDEIKQAINSVSLPDEVETFNVEQVVFYDGVADILIYGDLSLDELQQTVEKAKTSLREAGIAKIDVYGLPEKLLEVNVPVTTLLNHSLTLNDVAGQISQKNINLPSGNIDAQIETQLRFSSQSALVSDIEAISVNNLPINSLADVDYQYDQDQQRVYYNEKPAVQLSLSRAKGQDTLEIAKALEAWQASFETQLPQATQMLVFNENWKYVKSRVSIILENGAGGMLLVLIILFVFLNSRLAWWVAVGVPVSFLGALMVMDLSGNTINMISLFGFLIALGIIVDDAIVVGEEAYAQVEKGVEPVQASISAAQRMLPAVIASSITTIAAFLPLLLVGGQAGTFTKSVPLVVIFAIVASLIECFLILPGHLAHSLKNKKDVKPNKWRLKIDNSINYIKEVKFRPMVRYAVNHRRFTFAAVLLMFILSINLLTTGRVKFVFFPPIESPVFELKANFAQDSDGLTRYLNESAAQLGNIENDLGIKFIKTVFTKENTPHYGSVFVEINSDTDRGISNEEILNLWRDKLSYPTGLLEVGFAAPQQGPSTNGISVRLESQDLLELKQASNWLQVELSKLGTLIDVGDDLPIGAQQIVLSLNEEGIANNLNETYLANAIASLLNPVEVQSLRKQNEDVTVKVQLNQTVENWFELKNIPIQLPSGEFRPLGAYVNASYQQAIGQLNRVNGELSVIVSANRIDDSINLNEVNQQISQTLLVEVEQKFNVNVKLEGDAQGQSDFFIDVQFGAILGLFLIFGVLAWVFESYLWPVAVMAAIPLGLTGAIFGHWFLGLELSILSIYGLFGLSGIVINDSIVLVSFYRRLKEEGMEQMAAIEEAVVQRFRAVMLTSMTTCAGLSPLLFESSFDAQFLIPMAAGLVFGLAYATVLILLFVPALLMSLEKRINKRQEKRMLAMAS